MKVKTFFKVPVIRDKKYMEWISRQPCCLTGSLPPSDPHHENPPHDSGMGTKCGDDRCLPVRHDIHQKMENPNSSRKAVWAKYGVDPETLIPHFNEAYETATGRKIGQKK